MRKPDRFEKMVEKLDKTAAGFINNHGLVYPLDVVSLLRRQHRAYVRIVKRIVGFGIPEFEGNTISRREVLAAFARYRKGTR